MLYRRKEQCDSLIVCSRIVHFSCPCQTFPSRLYFHPRILETKIQWQNNVFF